MKKKTFKEVEAAFNQRGYTLVSEEYKGAHSSLDYRCSNDHQSKISFNSFQDGVGCSSCAGVKKKTIEEVRKLFESKNCQLLSDHYINSKLPLEYICCNGHQTTTIFSSFQKGIGCLDCSGVKKKTQSEVKSEFDKRGFSLISDTYKNSYSPMDYFCDKGHKGKICLSNLQRGVGCSSCTRKRKKTIKEVEAAFKLRDYTLVSKDYRTNNLPLEYICDKGHQTTISFSSLQKGHGCPSCAEYGFNPNKSATLYYIRFQYEGNFYYKIGITNRTISERFQSESTSYTIVKETTYTLGKDAHTQEQATLKKFSAYRYKGKPFLVSGNTELFIKDVLQIDYEPFQNFAA